MPTESRIGLAEPGHLRDRRASVDRIDNIAAYMPRSLSHLATAHGLLPRFLLFGVQDVPHQFWPYGRGAHEPLLDRGRMMAGNYQRGMEGRWVSGQCPIDPRRACNVGSRPAASSTSAVALQDLRHTHVRLGRHWGAVKAPNRLPTGGKMVGPRLRYAIQTRPQVQAEAMSPAPSPATQPENKG